MIQNKRYPFEKSWRWQIIRLLDAFFDLFSTSFKKRPFPKQVRRILVIRLDQIGDIVCALPVFSLLKRRFPEAQISALVSREGEAILKENPFVDEILVFQNNWFSQNRSFHPLQFLKILFTMRKKRFDLGFDLRGDLRPILLMVLAGVRYRIGYGIGGGGGLLQNERPYDMGLHQVELNARLVSDQILRKSDLKPEIYLKESEKLEVLNELRNRGAKDGARLIALHPEAGYPSKEWEEEKFRKLIASFLEDLHNTVLIFGISKKAEQLAGHFLNSSRVINLVSAFSLRRMIVALSQCDVFIGNDSGPSHIAQAVGIPVVVVASGTNEYEKWGVWCEQTSVLKHDVPCAPCHLQYCKVQGHPCMSEISVEEVSEAARKLAEVAG